MTEQAAEIVLSDGSLARFAGEQPLAEAINGPMIRLWNEAVRDANPLYHDASFARGRGHRDIVAPPAMLLAWTFEPTWRPTRGEVGVQERDLPDVPGYPHGAVLRITQTYHRLLELGEHPILVHYRTDPTAETDTHRGRGVITRQVMSLRDEHGTEVHRQESEVLRFAQATPVEPRPVPDLSGVPAAAGTPATALPSADQLQPGTRLPWLAFPLPLRQFMLAVSATRDYYAVHHDDAYARDLGVARGMYIGTHFLQGLIGRYVTDWSGPDGVMRRLELVPYSRNHVDDVVTVAGTVQATTEAGGESVVDLLVTLSNERELTHEAHVTLALRRHT